MDVWINLTLNILYTVHPFDELCVKCDLFGGGGERGKKECSFLHSLSYDILVGMVS